MKIERNVEAGTLTFSPNTDEEQQAIAAITGLAKAGESLKYTGRETENNVTTTLSFIACGLPVTLAGTSEADRSEVGRIRDMCFYGSGGLIIVACESSHLTVTGSLCKVCQKNMITRLECEWETCDACAATCEHEYMRGAIHGGGIAIGVGEFCEKCGRVKPGQPEKTPAAHLVSATTELGIGIIFE